MVIWLNCTQALLFTTLGPVSRGRRVVPVVAFVRARGVVFYVAQCSVRLSALEQVWHCVAAMQSRARSPVCGACTLHTALPLAAQPYRLLRRLPHLRARVVTATRRPCVWPRHDLTVLDLMCVVFSEQPCAPSVPASTFRCAAGPLPCPRVNVPMRTPSPLSPHPCYLTS